MLYFLKKKKKESYHQIIVLYWFYLKQTQRYKTWWIPIYKTEKNPLRPSPHEMIKNSSYEK